MPVEGGLPAVQTGRLRDRSGRTEMPVPVVDPQDELMLVGLADEVQIAVLIDVDGDEPSELAGG